MRYRYLIAALLVVILLADIGWKTWNERPYIVTGYSIQELAPGRSDVLLTVRYSLPRGNEGRWEVISGTGANQPYACWAVVQIGHRIPNCLRSFKAGFKP